MLERLAQLGVSNVVPWVTERTQHARELTPARRRRLERVLSEACKQCGRLWIPTLDEPRETWSSPELASHANALLEPNATHPLSTWAAALDTGRPLRIAVGPEGGLSDVEHARLVDEGFDELRVAPYVLRIETAAEAAVAIAVHGSASAMERAADEASKSMRSRSDT